MLLRLMVLWYSGGPPRVPRVPPRKTTAVTYFNRPLHLQSQVVCELEVYKYDALWVLTPPPLDHLFILFLKHFSHARKTTAGIYLI